jgi:hypothetical protein
MRKSGMGFDFCDIVLAQYAEVAPEPCNHVNTDAYSHILRRVCLYNKSKPCRTQGPCYTYAAIATHKAPVYRHTSTVITLENNSWSYSCEAPLIHVGLLP